MLSAMQKLNLQFKVLLSIFTVLIVMQGYLFYVFFKENGHTRDWVTHTYTVLFKLQNIAEVIDQDKLHKIAYLTKGDPSLLQNITDPLLLLTEIKHLTKDNSMQQEELLRLETLLTQRQIELNRIVSHWSMAQSYQSLLEILDKENITLDTKIDKSIQTLEKEENRLLQMRESQSTNARAVFMHFNATAAIISYLVLLGLILSLMKTINAQKRIESQRIAADAKFRKLFEMSSDAHMLYDQNGIIDCNEAVLKTLKCYQKSQIIGINPFSFSPPTQPDGTQSAVKGTQIEAEAREKGFLRFEWILERLDHVEVPIEVSLTPIELNDKEIFLVIWHDIAEQKKYQNMLEQLHKINATKHVSLHSKIHQIITLGRQYLRMSHGVIGNISNDKYQLLYWGSNDTSILPSKVPLGKVTANLFDIKFLLALEDLGSKEASLLEFPIKCYIGCPIYVNDQQYATISFFRSKPRSEPFSETEKTFIHLIAQWIGSEIEKSLTLQQLEANKERLERAIKSANDGLWEWNCITNKVYVNPRYVEILGYEEKDMGDSLDFFINLIHKDDIDRVWEAINATLQDHQYYNVEFRFRRKDDSYVWVRCRGDVYRDPNGQPTLMTGFITDISEFKDQQKNA
jgi:PAS domain S-box-containing protein